MRCCSPRSRGPGPSALRVRDRSASMHPSRPLVAPSDPRTRKERRTGPIGCASRGRPGSIVAAAQDQLRGPLGPGARPGRGLRERRQRPADESRGARSPPVRRSGSGSTACSPSIGARGRHAGRTPTCVIEGDPELQLAVRFAIFHLLASAPDGGEAAVGARGLTGSAYRGHVFWDTDVYVLPMLAATHPQAARAILEYRVRRLPAAIRAAQAPATRRRAVPVGVRTVRSKMSRRNTRVTGTASSYRS